MPGSLPPCCWRPFHVQPRAVSGGIVTLGAVIVLNLKRVIDHAGAFGGLGNQAPITIAALYILAAGVEATGALTGLTEKRLGLSLRMDRVMR